MDCRLSRRTQPLAFPEFGSFDEFAGAPLGKILLIQTRAVSLPFIVGVYEHFRFLPALKADHDSPDLLGEWRSTVLAKSIMLFFDVPAWLVAASS